MSNLNPELRPDKNGKLVTRHVKQDEPVSLRIVGAKPVSPAVTPSRITTDTSYDVAQEAFDELNPGNEELFEHFFLGSTEESDYEEQILAENPELDFEEIKQTALANGFTGYWLNDENLNFPEDVEPKIASRDYGDILSELQLMNNTTHGSEALRLGDNDLEVYAAYAELNGPDDVQKVVTNADAAYRGSFRADEDFAEDMFVSTFGYSSQEGIEELSNHIDWDRVAVNMTLDEMGIEEDTDEDDENGLDRSPTADEARDYFENSIGDVSSISNLVDWSTYSRSVLNDYSEYKGHYFRN
jgi:hypothetical protein